MSIQKISTDKAAAAIGPYSQAIKAGNLIYTSGQIPVSPVIGEIVQGGIKEQTRQSILNLKNILEAAGSSLEQVIKTTVYITDMNNFSTVNQIYADFFSGSLPARSCVEVSKLPKGALVEIEAIAYAG